MVKSLWLRKQLLGLLPLLADKLASLGPEGLDDLVLGDPVLSSHHNDGLSLGGLASLDLNSFNTVELFDRRTDESFTSGSSDTSKGGLVFDVRTVRDAQQHNRQQGDKVMYFHGSRTDGISIREQHTFQKPNLNRLFGFPAFS